MIGIPKKIGVQTQSTLQNESNASYNPYPIAMPLVMSDAELLAIKNTLLADSNLVNILKGTPGTSGSKGDKGDTGLKGDKGDNGLNGLSSDNQLNYGGSIIRNSDLALGTSNWTHGTPEWNLGTITENALSGYPSIKKDTHGFATNDFFVRNPNSLYKLEVYVRGYSGSLYVFTTDYATNGTAPMNKAVNSGGYGAFAINGQSFGGSWVQMTGYIGGVGMANMNFTENSVKSKLSVSANGAMVEFARLILKEVSLGEPVPFNLSYLPKGQMVYDPTTWEVGIFNGVSITWFAS